MIAFTEKEPTKSEVLNFQSLKIDALQPILFERTAMRMLLLLISLLAALFGLGAPYLQKLFVDGLTSGTTTESLIVYAIFAFVFILANQACNQLANFLGAREAIIAQGKLAKTLYSKTLELKVDTLSRKSLGEIVALYATDVPGSTILLEQTLPQGASTFFPLILAPLFLAMILDSSLWLPVIVLFGVSAFNTLLAFRQSKFFFYFKQLAAERIGLVSEWINQIRGLRILGWTEAFEDRILKKRIAETKNRVSMVTNGQVMNSISSSMTFAINIIALASIILLHEKNLTPGEILASLWILGIFLTRPFRQMPWFFTFAFDAWTSIKRLNHFFRLENYRSQQLNSNSARVEPNSNPPSQFPLSSTISFSTPSQTPHRLSPNVDLNISNLNLEILGKPILSQISLSIKRGEFVALVGEVGSGKTLFLLSLLGETGASFDKFEIQNKNVNELTDDQRKSFFSFVPQEAFVMSASIEQNVIFDYQINEPFKSNPTEALKLAQLSLEQERFHLGLQTPIGERGVNLSGGQKQRISFARAVFFDRPIILVDDGFSNLDQNTEESLLSHLFLSAWKDNTRIMSTHRLNILPLVDRIFFFQQGKIKSIGTYLSLVQNDPEFSEFTKSLRRQQEQR